MVDFPSGNVIKADPKQLNRMLRHLGESLEFIEKTTQPSCKKPVCILLWHDTTNSKYYLIANFNGTEKKVELT